MTTLGPQVLAGDIGGTKTVLSIFERRGAHWEELATTTFASAQQTGLEPPTRAFLQTAGVTPDAAVFGVAGPVVDGRCHTTNLPWVVDRRALASVLGIARVDVVNDFAASAVGLGELTGPDLVCIQPGNRDPEGVIAVIGAGTGLGQTVVVRHGGVRTVLPSEGGHTTFAPQDATQDALLAFARTRFPDHVSYERIVSGPGLVLVHDFVRASGLAVATPEALSRIEREDPAAVIGELGVTGADPACILALDLFVAAYGAAAGDLALRALPKGGLFVTGGIAPKILPALQREGFVAAFHRKGRLRTLLERIPIDVVLQPRVGLLGARTLAAELALAQ